MNPLANFQTLIGTILTADKLREIYNRARETGDRYEELRNLPNRAREEIRSFPIPSPIRRVGGGIARRAARVVQHNNVDEGGIKWMRFLKKDSGLRVLYFTKNAWRFWRTIGIGGIVIIGGLISVWAFGFMVKFGVRSVVSLKKIYSQQVIEAKLPKNDKGQNTKKSKILE